MPKTVEVEIYRFDELTPEVQLKVAEKWNEFRVQADVMPVNEFVAEQLLLAHGIEGVVEVDEGSQHFFVFVNGESVGAGISLEMYRNWCDYLYPEEEELLALAGESAWIDETPFLVDGRVFYP